MNFTLKPYLLSTVPSDPADQNRVISLPEKKKTDSNRGRRFSYLPGFGSEISGEAIHIAEVGKQSELERERARGFLDDGWGNVEEKEGGRERVNK